MAQPVLIAHEQAAAQHKAVLAAALDPIITIDSKGVIQSASDSIQRVFGWTPAEVIGRNINILMPEPHHSAHDGYLSNYRQTHKTNILGRTREFSAVRKDGSLIPIELSVSRVDIPGANEPWFMGIIHDITDRRRAEDELARYRAHLEDMVKQRTSQLESTNEQLRQADRLASIGTLAAGLGHDMNNVLLPIRARLDALDAANLPEHAKEQFQAVRRSVAYLQQLSDGLHLLALDPEDADASGAVTDIADWWKQVGPLLAKAVPKRIAVHVEIPAGLNDAALAPHRLTQAVLNLVVNAGEAIRGEGMIRIWARPAQRDGFILLGVTDNGEGMSPEVRQQAFDPFFTTKKRGLGTGLGLSLVRGVAQTAGGSVVIDSEPGRGTTVILELPVATNVTASSTVDAGNVAVIAIRNRRAAMFVAAMMKSARFSTRMAEGSERPSNSQLWVVEPECTTMQAIRTYLRSDRSRRVVLFGHPPDDWSRLGAFVISDPSDFEQIRSTLGDAMNAVSRNHS